MTGDGSVALKPAASPKSLLVVVAAAGVPSESAIAEAELARTATKPETTAWPAKDTNK